MSAQASKLDARLFNIVPRQIRNKQCRARDTPFDRGFKAKNSYSVENIPCSIFFLYRLLLLMMKAEHVVYRNSRGSATRINTLAVFFHLLSWYVAMDAPSYHDVRYAFHSSTGQVDI